MGSRDGGMKRLQGGEVRGGEIRERKGEGRAHVL